VATAASLSAHHSFSAEFDASKPVTMKGTVTKMEWINPHVWLYMDVKTPDGKTQQVAVNARTVRQVEIKKGAEVTVDYYRKIGKYIIARRVLPLEKNQPAAAQAAQSLTGKIVSATSAALVLRTGAGDVDLFLSPSTQVEVKSLAPGKAVTVEYQTVANGYKLAQRVLAPQGETPPSR